MHPRPLKKNIYEGTDDCRPVRRNSEALLPNISAVAAWTIYIEVSLSAEPDVTICDYSNATEAALTRPHEHKGSLPRTKDARGRVVVKVEWVYIMLL